MVEWSGIGCAFPERSRWFECNDPVVWKSFRVCLLLRHLVISIRMITQTGDLRPSSYTSGGTEKTLAYGQCLLVESFGPILQV